MVYEQKQEVVQDVESETLTVTLLLADLRGFTAMSEQYSAMEVVAMLNRFYEKMNGIIFKNGGTVDKFMGDAILAVFGVTPARSDDLERALTCAIEMQIAMSEINSINAADDMADLYLGIGINTGEVVAGRVGSGLHSEYTVIGDQVNLTFRIESHSLRGQILLSENSYLLAKDFIEVGYINEVLVKGKKAPVKMYELLSTNRPDFLAAPRSEARRAIRVEVNLPFIFHRVFGSSVDAEQYAGRVLNMCYEGGLIISPIPLPNHSEIKIPLSLSVMGYETGDIYAKVVRSGQIQQGGYECALEVTSIHSKAQKALKDYIDRLIDAGFGD